MAQSQKKTPKKSAAKKQLKQIKNSAHKKPQKLIKKIQAKSTLKVAMVKAAPAKSVSMKTLPIKIAPVKVLPKQVIKTVTPVNADQKHYRVGDHVVYPTHGVGRIAAEETQMIGDISLRLLVIAFEKDKMTLRVPVHRAAAAGLRPISTGERMKKVFITLKSRARTSRGMWSRRAQEYETKINSGSIISIAEVVRDLHQNVDQSERSYSERMIYESALSRLVGELAAAEATDHKTATDKLMKLLRAKIAAAAIEKEAA